MTGRVCHAIELNPAYVDVAVLRWQAFTGEEARLDGDGQLFEEVWAKRGASRDGKLATAEEARP